MSKAVRIREHLYAEIEALAKAERRSLISQLEVLLEQALALRESHPPEARKVELVEADAQPREIPARRVQPGADDHFKPDFKK